MQNQSDYILDQRTLSDPLWEEEQSDKELYQHAFFDEVGGETLEVAMLWGDHLISLNNYTQKGITIGSDHTADVVLEGFNFKLVSYDAFGYSVNFDTRMSGLIHRADATITLEEALAKGQTSIPLDSQTSVRIDIDEMTFLIHLTDIPIPVGNRNAIDTSAMPYIGLSGFGHLLLLFLALMIPESARAMNLDMFEAEDRFVQILLDPIEEIEAPSDENQGDGEETASKHEGEEGKAGDENTEVKNKKLAIKGEAEDITLKRSRDKSIAMNSGIASLVMVTSPFGSDADSVGSDIEHATGLLEGDEIGSVSGLGGLSVRGAGRGGGGNERGIGIDSMGTKKGKGIGKNGRKYGRGPSNGWDKDTKVPGKVIPGPVLLDGGLDRSIIQRVVRQHRRELKYCYELGLQKNRNLTGTVKVKFVISAGGNVMSARVLSSTLKDKKVQSCMTGKIRRWVFPEAKGGKITSVKYPFNLKR